MLPVTDCQKSGRRVAFNISTVSYHLRENNHRDRNGRLYPLYPSRDLVVGCWVTPRIDETPPLRAAARYPRE